MSRTKQSLVFITYLAFGLVAVGSAQAGDVFKGGVFKGSVTGDATFTDNADGTPGVPQNGFQTDNAIGTITHLGQTLVTLVMEPSQADGSKGFSGAAMLTAANGDELDMTINTGNLETVSVSDDGQVVTVACRGTYQMTGGTGRFEDASLLTSKVTITITCDFRKLAWTITIRW